MVHIVEEGESGLHASDEEANDTVAGGTVDDGRLVIGRLSFSTNAPSRRSTINVLGSPSEESETAVRERGRSLTRHQEGGEGGQEGEGEESHAIEARRSSISLGHHL